jgi:hypothetical protein
MNCPLNTIARIMGKQNGSCDVYCVALNEIYWTKKPHLKLNKTGKDQFQGQRKEVEFAQKFKDIIVKGLKEVIGEK